jgi:hypothetical protein
MFDDEPSHFNALMSGVAIGAIGVLFWVVVVWVAS